MDVGTLETKDNAPIRVYGNSPKLPEATRQLMQTIARKIHGKRTLGLIEAAQNVTDPISQIGTNSARIIVFVKAFETPVSEAYYHLDYTVN